MDTEKYTAILELMDDVLLHKLANALGNEPVVFTAVWHCRQWQIMYKGFEENIPLDEIASLSHASKRTVYRHLRKYFKCKK